MMDDHPKKEKKDYGYDIAKATINLIPIVGGSLASIFETVLSAPIDKRKEVWLNQIAETVNDLCEKVDALTPEKLANNPEFVSIFLQASNIAVRTHHEEKLEALNNAVKNSVLMKDVIESKKMIFLRIIDQLTPIHFKVLDFLSSPQKYTQIVRSREASNVTTNYGSLRTVWDKLNYDIKADDKIIELAITDLKGWGLTHSSKFYEASFESNSTSLGREFVEFISNKT